MQGISGFPFDYCTSKYISSCYFVWVKKLGDSQYGKNIEWNSCIIGVLKRILRPKERKYFWYY